MKIIEVWPYRDPELWQNLRSDICFDNESEAFKANYPAFVDAPGMQKPEIRSYSALVDDDGNVYPLDMHPVKVLSSSDDIVRTQALAKLSPTEIEALKKSGDIQ